MSRAVLWDSSAILAVLDADDAGHARALSVATELAVAGRPGFVTNYLAAEAHALLLRRLGRALAREWLFGRTLPVVRASPTDEERAHGNLARHLDKDWSLCDAISFAVMDARRVSTAFSFDRHFRQYGRYEVLGPG